MTAAELGGQEAYRISRVIGNNFVCKIGRAHV